MKKIALLLLLVSLSIFGADTPVSLNGKLSVKKYIDEDDGIERAFLTNKIDSSIQLRGMSTHGLQWYNDMYTDNAFNALANNWGADVVRLSLYAQEDGYSICEAGHESLHGNYRDLEEHKKWWRNRIDELVNLATTYGMYVLIDWHMLDPGNPYHSDYYSDAVEYWTYMATKHGGKENVLFEICNEPNNEVDEDSVYWDNGGNKDLVDYANEFIGIIRANDPDDNKNIIICGTPTWASSPNEVINSEVDLPENVMYTMHFYAASHLADGPYMDRMMEAINGGIPVFVTEFGTQGYSGGKVDGDGDINGNDFTSSQLWLDALEKYKVSWCNWNFSDDKLSGAVFNENAINSGSTIAAFSNTNKMKAAGIWIKQRISSPADHFPVYTGPTWTITASSSAGGTIFPATATVPDEGSKAFSFTPNNGYKVSGLKLGSGVTNSFSDLTYDFTNITSDSAIHVTFEEIVLIETVIEDFANEFNDPDSQTTLAAAYGYANGDITSGGGYWKVFKDDYGSSVKSGGSAITSATFDDAVNSGLLSVEFAMTSLVEEKYPYCGVEFPFTGAKLENTIDLSLMDKLIIVASGTGTVRVSLPTQDVYDNFPGKPDEAWGFYGKNIILSGGTSRIEISPSDLIPDDGSSRTWDEGKSEVYSLQFEAVNYSTTASMVIDSIIMVGVNYDDFGFTYVDFVEDNTAPIFDTPLQSNISTSTDVGKNYATVEPWNTPTATDNVDGTITATTSDKAVDNRYDMGTHEIIYTATDAAGNSSQMSFDITVTDAEKPTISGFPPNISVEISYGKSDTTISWTEPSSADNVGVTSFTSNVAVGATFILGTTSVKYTARDAVGNTRNKTFTVTVTEASAPVDSEKPTITDQDDIDVNTDATENYATVSWTPPTISDNIGVDEESISYTPTTPTNNQFPVGVTTVSYYAKDAAGNDFTMSFTVTVTKASAPADSEKPKITPVLNISENTDAGENYATVTWTPPTISDNVGVDEESITYTPVAPTNSQFPVGVTTVSYYVKDAAGNDSTMSFDVTVTEASATVDNEKPFIINMPADIKISINSADELVEVSWDEPDATDNSGDVELSCSRESGAEFGRGTYTITYTAKDPSNNTVSDSFTVTLDLTSAITVENSPAVAPTRGIVAVPSLVREDDNKVHIVVSEGISGEGTMNIYDVLGNLVDEQTISLNDGGHFSWDLRNFSGIRVASGTYVVTLQVKDARGNGQYKTIVGVKQ
jgi:aryl-phospho-beta-D-glucosidase BglC (GH1 family)